MYLESQICDDVLAPKKHGRARSYYSILQHRHCCCCSSCCCSCCCCCCSSCFTVAAVIVVDALDVVVTLVVTTVAELLLLRLLYMLHAIVSLYFGVVLVIVATLVFLHFPVIVVVVSLAVIVSLAVVVTPVVVAVDVVVALVVVVALDIVVVSLAAVLFILSDMRRGYNAAATCFVNIQIVGRVLYLTSLYKILQYFFEFVVELRFADMQNFAEKRTIHCSLSNCSRRDSSRWHRSEDPASLAVIQDIFSVKIVKLICAIRTGAMCANVRVRNSG